MSNIDEHIWWARHAKVRIEQGGVQATFLLLEGPDEDAPNLTNNGLEGFLHFSQVKFGIDYEKCSQIIENPIQFIGSQVVIANGIPPKHGTDASFEIHIQREDDQRPRELEDGRVDFFEVGTVRTVRAGELLATKKTATLGEKGTSVTGQPIAAKPGKEIRLPQGKNTVVGEGGLQLYATVDGHFLYTSLDEKVNVFSVYDVPTDVDFSVGNIDFIGSVKIRGNVQPGFRVVAAGDIDVWGYVDSAVLEAGGNITIRGGLQGRNKGILKAGGSIRTLFIQSATVEAGGEVFVGESIMHSQVTAVQKIILEGRKAVIVGGISRAGEEIRTRVLGSPMATPTELEVGVHPQLRRELSDIHAGVKELQGNIDKTEKALAILNHQEEMSGTGKLSPEKELMKQKLVITLEHYRVEEEDLLIRRSSIEEALMDIKSAKITVTEIVHPGIKLMIGQQIHYVRDGISRVTFQLKDGEIYHSSL